MPRKKAIDMLPPEGLPDALPPDESENAAGAHVFADLGTSLPEPLETSPELPAVLPEPADEPPQEESAPDVPTEEPEGSDEPAKSPPEESDTPVEPEDALPDSTTLEGNESLSELEDSRAEALGDAETGWNEALTPPSDEDPASAAKEASPARHRRTMRQRAIAPEAPTLQASPRQVSSDTAAGILSIDAKAEVETEEYREDTIWHEIRNAYRTRRILTGTLGGVEQTDDGKSLVIVEYKGFRVVIPAKEMMLTLGRWPSGNDYAALMRRHNQILSAMMGAEIDFIIRGIDNKTRSIVASRKEAMLKKRQIFYLDQDASGAYRISPGRLVQSRVTAVAEKVIRIEAFGVECPILARDLAWDWMGDAHDHYSVGDRIVVRILDVQRNSLEDIVIRADVKSVSSTTDLDNLKKCRVQGKYAGKVTDVHKGVVFVRLTNGVNAIAHACLDRRMPGKKDDISFAVTHIDPEQGVAFGIITRIIKQNL